jgi:predicted transcriptional regulator
VLHHFRKEAGKLSSEKKFILTISLDLNLKEPLNRVAREQNRTRSGMIQQMVYEFFQREKIESKLWQKSSQ